MECWVLLRWISVHNCSTFSQPADQASLLQGQQTYLPLHMFDYVALDQHTCLKSSNYFCNSFMRLAGMLQCLYFKRCFEQTGMFVAVSPDHLTLQLQLNSTSMSVSVASTIRYVWISGNWLTSTSVVVWPNQQVYMLHLPQTRSYVPMLVPN